MRSTKAPIKAISIYNDLDIEVKVIFIPPGQRIPLHDHPGMFVFQKILCGEMRYQDGDLNFDATKTVGEYDLVKIQAKDDMIVD